MCMYDRQMIKILIIIMNDVLILHYQVYGFMKLTFSLKLEEVGMQ